MTLELLPQRFSVLKLRSVPENAAGLPFFFLSRTDKELSLVCPEEDAPNGFTAREDGFRAMRVSGTLDFSLVGILSALSGALAQADVPVFAVSTYDTDYLLVPGDRLEKACLALRRAGFVI